MCSFQSAAWESPEHLRLQNSQHQACFVKLKPRIARRETAPVAVSQVNEKIHLPLAVGKEFGVDLGRIESRHRSAIQSQGARGENKMPCPQRAVAERGFIAQGPVPGKHGAEISLRK